jgi:peptide/nickel transport system ATP-binding protein
MYMGVAVENGPVEDVLTRPAHPYTSALLRSIPVLGQSKAQKLEPIRGSTPDPFNRPQGCQFHPRCDFATEQCLQEPETFSVSPNHTVRCWHYEKVLANA